MWTKVIVTLMVLENNFLCGECFCFVLFLNHAFFYAYGLKHQVVTPLSVAIFHFSWKIQLDVWGNVSDQGVVIKGK